MSEDSRIIAFKMGVERKEIGGFYKLATRHSAEKQNILLGYGVTEKEFEELWAKEEPLEYFKYASPEWELWADVKLNLPLDVIIKGTKLKESDLKEIWKSDKKQEDKQIQKEREPKFKDTISGKFIFDEQQIVNEVVFSSHKINNNFGYGFLLPKEIPVYAKAKKDEPPKIVARTQIRSPAVITSDKLLIEPTPETESKHKIKYVAIPTSQELRWDLNSIKNYLESKELKVNPLELFNSIKKNGYEKFIFVQNPIWYDIHALWDMGTYFFQLFNTYPLFELRGLSGTAKSKTMNVSRLYSLNPTSIMVNPSEASLFRVTHSNRPTKYIDEAEKLFLFIGGKWISSPIVELINGSYTKGSSVPRLEKEGNSFKLVYYQCYSPTMLGSITGLRDATETRAITHIMTKAPDGDLRGEIEVQDYEKESIYQEIRNNLYIFALNNWENVESYYNSFGSIEGLKKRDFQLWKPLLTIAKIIDGSLYDKVLQFARKISEQKRQDFIPEGSLDYKIIQFLKEESSKGSIKIYIKGICENLNVSSEKKIAEKTVSTHLDKLGFKEFRAKDRNGSYLEVSQEVIQIITSPLIPDLSSQSSQSSQSHINDKKEGGELVMNSDEYNNKPVTNVTNVTNMTNILDEDISLNKIQDESFNPQEVQE